MEYLAKVCHTNQRYCGMIPDTTVLMETKLGTIGDWKGFMTVAFGEGFKAHHSLIHHLAIFRMRVVVPQQGKMEQVRKEEAEIAITPLWRTLSLCCVQGHAATL